MCEATLRKITIRQLGPAAPPTAMPIGPEEMHHVRRQAHLSRAAPARDLNLTAG
jgi:putative transcriptional regulator